MKRFSNKLVLISIVLLLLTAGAFGQTSISVIQDNFKSFSEDVSQALPHAASTGLTWSDARVRGFPHFGVGVSVGVVMLPTEAFEKLAGPTALNFPLPEEITTTLGVPFPSYALDARVGIPFLPFDVGAKLGLLTPEMAESLGGDVDYMLAGFDLRFPILKGNLLMPALSVSAGYNYLSGGVSTVVTDAGALGSGITYDDGTTIYEINYSSPDVRFDWQTHALDFKVQASKGLLIFTPYLGGAYSYGWSKAGGGVESDLTFSPTEEEVRDALEAAGYDVELSDTGFTILSESTGGSLRAFGGFSVNLLILKLDVNGQYNFTTQSLGAGVNARIQL